MLSRRAGAGRRRLFCFVVVALYAVAMLYILWVVTWLQRFDTGQILRCAVPIHPGKLLMPGARIPEAIQMVCAALVAPCAYAAVVVPFLWFACSGGQAARAAASRRRLR
jgi:hypothetical protein